MRQSAWQKLLTSVVLLELLLCAGHWSQHSPRALPPNVNLAGYPAFTRRAVEHACERLRRLDSPSAGDWDQLADTLSAAGRYAEAVACYQEATRCEPEAAQFHYDLAFCLMSTGRLRDADEQFQRAASLEPRLRDTQRYFAGINALRRGDADMATSEFERSDLAAAKLQLAILALEQNQSERCRNLLAQTLPTGFRVQQLLSQLDAASGDTAAAKRRMALTDHLDGIVAGPWNERAAMIVARTEAISTTTQKLQELNQLTADPAAVTRRIQTDQSQIWEPELEDLLADAALAADDRAAHIAHLEALIARDGGSTYRMNRLGFALISAGERQRGREVLQTGHQLLGTATPQVAADNCLALAELTAETDPQASDRYRGQALRLLGDYEAALQIDDQQASIWFLHALRFDRIAAGLIPDAAQTPRQAASAAIAAYQKCLALEPEHATARLMLNQLQVELKSSQ